MVLLIFCLFFYGIRECFVVQEVNYQRALAFEFSKFYLNLAREIDRDTLS